MIEVNTENRPLINSMSNEIVYNDGELELKVSVDRDTLWIKTEEIVDIFDINRPTVVKHIGNIYKSQELEENSTCSILEQAAKACDFEVAGVDGDVFAGICRLEPMIEFSKITI